MKTETSASKARQAKATPRRTIVVNRRSRTSAASDGDRGRPRTLREGRAGLKPKKSSRSKEKRTIGDVMTSQPWTIGREQTLKTAHVMMRSHGIRHLPVLERGQIVGVITQRDLYFLETIQGVDIDADQVNDGMTPDAYAVSPDTPLAEVAETMVERKLGCAVVVERDRVVGIFTATDALRLLSA
jgi:acetoin utilization protein AcuB